MENKVIITITESDVTENWMVKEGNIHVEAEFHPAIRKGDRNLPMTHTAAMAAIKTIVDGGVGEPIVTHRPPADV